MFESPCCKKIIACTDWTEPSFALSVASDGLMQQYKIVGDNKMPEGHRELYKRKTEPRWAHVYSNGPFWFVRIIPPCDLQEHGRGHGVALANKYTTKAEANVFADSMESYFGDAEHDIKVTAQTDIQ
jgi:hypothetical protein